MDETSNRKKRNQVEDPLWKWAEQVGRDEGDGADVALDDQAAARLGMLRQAAGNFAAPVFNALAARQRMCVECGKRMPAEPPAPSGVCSPECASKLGARKKGGAQAASRVETGETARISLGSVVEASGDKKKKK